MTATNHALAGAVIGLSISNPVLALPLALISHFVMDAIPHFGLDELGGHLKNNKLFQKFLRVDALLLAAFLLFLFFSGAGLLVFACVFLAGSPDFVWAYRYIFQEKLGKHSARPKNRFNQWHANIQTSQTLKGLWIEIPVAVALFVVVIKLL